MILKDVAFILIGVGIGHFIGYRKGYLDALEYAINEVIAILPKKKSKTTAELIDEL